MRRLLSALTSVRIGKTRRIIQRDADLVKQNGGHGTPKGVRFGEWLVAINIALLKECKTSAGRELRIWSSTDVTPHAKRCYSFTMTTPQRFTTFLAHPRVAALRRRYARQLAFMQ